MNKFMEKFMKFFEEKITPPLTKVSEVKHLRAIRDGIISTMPLILIGCMFLVIFKLILLIYVDLYILFIYYHSI